MPISGQELEREEALMGRLIESCGQEFFRPGLERVFELAGPFKEIIERAQFQNQLKIVTIAGTNGKGQTTYDLAYDLMAKGRSSAVWISPHILSLRERMSAYSCGQSHEISYDELEEGLEFFCRLYPPKTCSFYEMLFLIFLRWTCQLLAEGKINTILFEVGLGGRYDAVNIFDADLTAITSISRDHEAILGRGFARILSEKLGVARAKRPMITALELRYCQEKAAHYLKNLETPTIDLFLQNIVSKNDSYFMRNRILAIALSETLGKGDINLLELKKTIEERRPALDHFPVLKGRFERVTGLGRCFIFVGAHNLDGIRNLVGHQFSQDLGGKREILCSFSQRPEEEIKACLKSLEMLGPLRVGEFNHPKASKLNPRSLELNAVEISGDGECDSKKRPFECHTATHLFSKDWKNLLRYLGPGPIWVTGSYYFIGEVQKFLAEESAHSSSPFHFSFHSPFYFSLSNSSCEDLGP